MTLPLTTARFADIVKACKRAVRLHTAYNPPALPRFGAKTLGLGWFFLDKAAAFMIKLSTTVSAEAGAYSGARAMNYIIEKEINMEIRKIFVVGSGLMGSGIAQTAIQRGYEVILNDQAMK